MGGMPMGGMPMGGMGGGINPEMLSQMFGGMDGMPRRAQSQPRRRPDAMPQGTNVVIHGLRNAPEKNGDFAIVMDFDDSKQRYVVQLDDGATLSLKPQNL